MNTNSICSSCRHESDCTFINHAQAAIINCEEFELEAVSKNRIEESPSPIPVNGHSGLCKSCRYQDHCTLQNSDCVIWHCEEFAN